jgi:hypothetical protein
MVTIGNHVPATLAAILLLLAAVAIGWLLLVFVRVAAPNGHSVATTPTPVTRILTRGCP